MVFVIDSIVLWFEYFRSAIAQKSIQRPAFSQSPKRVGSGPSRPPISLAGSSATSCCLSAAGPGDVGCPSTAFEWVAEIRSAFFGTGEVCQTEYCCAERFKPSFRKFPSIEQCRALSLYKFILVSGNDALAFLQGQLTQDLERLGPGICLPAAWCNAQGRVLMTLRVVRDGERFALTVGKDIEDFALSRLQMYRLRSKVEFSAGDAEWQVFALPGLADTSDTIDGHSWQAHVPGEEAFTEVVVHRTAGTPNPRPGTAALDDEAWRAARIRAGYVDIAATNSALYTPHMLNLDRCGAISFEKGCYTGQEIVARTEHRGRSKRRTLRFTCEAPGLVTGDKLVDGESEIGTVVNACGNECLAVVPLDAIGGPLTVRGHPAKPLPLPYAVSD